MKQKTYDKVERKMMIRKKLKIAPSLAIAVCLGILLLASFNCKNPAGPEDTASYITVRNGCGIALDIYMDSAFQFFLGNNEYYYIENVAPGTHLLEAKKEGTDTLIRSETVDIEETKSYIWTITSSASLRVTNNYGETVDLYGDGKFQSEIANQSEAFITNIPYGNHFLEAKKQGGTTVVASITIEIYEDILYTWIIQK